MAKETGNIHRHPSDTGQYWLVFSQTHGLLLAILIGIQYLFFIIPLQFSLLMIAYFKVYIALRDGDHYLES